MAARHLLLGNGSIMTYDEEDESIVSGLHWYCGGTKTHPYASHAYKRGDQRGVILLHRLILDAPDGVNVDHINGNTLDNRRENLRLSSRAGNARNRKKVPGKTSRFKGVCWLTRAHRWQAQVRAGETLYCEQFTDEIAAAIAHDLAAIELHQDYASLNFPEAPYFSVAGKIRRKGQ